MSVNNQINNGSFVYDPRSALSAGGFAIRVEDVENLFSAFGPGVDGDDRRIGKGASAIRDTLVAAISNKMREGERVIVQGELRGPDNYRKIAATYGYAPYIVGETRKGWTTIDQDGVDNLGVIELENLDAYDKVIVVGDVQSCPAPLRALVDEYGRRGVFYVFCGDLFDRGPDAAEVLRIVRGLNRVVVKGNHERNMEEALRGNTSKRSTNVSLEQITEGGMLKGLHKELAVTVPFFPFEFRGVEYWTTHGGVMGSAIEEIRCVGEHGVHFYADFIARSYYMFGSGAAEKNLAGVGDYDLDEAVLSASMENTSAAIQFHGHRNKARLAPDAVDRIGVMESRVERDGWLTAAVIDDGGVRYVTY